MLDFNTGATNTVHFLRRALHHSKLTPVAVETKGKRPSPGDKFTDEWQLEMPRAVEHSPNLKAMSTGILTRGLAVFDNDIDDECLNGKIDAAILQICGPSPTRTREGSPRTARFYKAEGMPAKRSIYIAGKKEPIVEILGNGQQIIIDGLHQGTGKPYVLSHRPASGMGFTLDELPTVSAAQVDAACAEICRITGGYESGRTEPRLAGAEKGPKKEGVLTAEFKKLRPEHMNSAVKAALANINIKTSDPRVQWLNVVWSCAHAQSLGASEALALVLEWAKSGANYAGAESDAEIESEFKRADNRTEVATVLFLAMQTAEGHFAVKTAMAMDVFPPLTAEDTAGAPEMCEDVNVWQPSWRYTKDIIPDTTAHLWDETIRRGDSTVIYGPPFVGKSIFMAGLVCAIAHGLPFMGRDCQKGAVYIVELEGVELMADNIRAWHRHHSLEDEGSIAISPSYINLANAESMRDLERDIENFARRNGSANGKYALDLIVIDTLSQALAGEDENAQGPMSAAIKALQLLGRKFNASTLLLHHSGHSDGGETRERGSSVIRANLHNSIQLKEGTSGTIQVSYKKLKIGRRPPSDFFTINSMPMADFPDYKGRPSHGGVAVQAVAEDVKGAQALTRLKGEKESIMRMLKEAESEPFAEVSTDKLSELHFKDHASSALPKTRKDSFRKNLMCLEKQKLILRGLDGKTVRRTAHDAAPLGDQRKPLNH